MKILMISPQFKPIIGGYERAAERMSRGLLDLGHQVLVVAERRQTQWLKHESIDGLKVRRLWCRYRPGWHILTSALSFSAFMLIQGWRYQIFHIHQHGVHAALSIGLGKWQGKKSVLNLTSSGPEGIVKAIATDERDSWGSRFIHWLHTQVDACIAISERGREEALTLGIPPERIHLIPQGVDADYFKPANSLESAKANLQLSGYRTVVFVGRFAAAKNLPSLINAWSIVCEHLDDVRLVLVGAGEKFKEIEGLIEYKGIKDKIILAGASDNVLPWYQAGDVFVLSSDYEGLSNSLLEAMSCGLPVVSTRVSGSTDVFAQADIGEMVNVGDASALAMALKSLLESASRRQHCGAAARALIVQQYSLASAAKQVANLYASLVT
jgi:glycosyltransferase involved in cell wall biosynthesis